MRLTVESEIPIFQYSGGRATGRPVGDGTEEEGAEEGAPGGRGCGRAAGAPMLSAPLRLADDLSCSDQPSLPAFRPSGPVAGEHSASVHEREFEMSLFSLPVN